MPVPGWEAMVAAPVGFELIAFNGEAGEIDGRVPQDCSIGETIVRALPSRAIAGKSPVTNDTRVRLVNAK